LATFPEKSFSAPTGDCTRDTIAADGYFVWALIASKCKSPLIRFGEQYRILQVVAFFSSYFGNSTKYSQ
jgi:hypothetical protein